MTKQIDIHEASDEKPIVAKHEPGFRRFYAQGSLIHNNPEEPEMVRIAFWSERVDDLPLDENLTGTGYSLEAETVMTWGAAKKLHFLIGKWLEEHQPQKE